jgi:hypothetical protein
MKSATILVLKKERKKMTDERKLAEIIKANPGAVAYIDNDNWHLDKPIPHELANWSEEKQNEWYDSCELTNSAAFPKLGVSYGHGLLQAMAALLDIKLEIV